MKIVAQLNREGSLWLVQMSTHEIGRVQGKYTESNAQLGLDVPVSDIYETAGHLLAGAEDLIRFQSSLEKLLAATQKLSGAIQPAVDTVKTKRS